ncbi:MAG: hypothetical protein LCH52_08310 [Bacteroidetes bacterium]|nr:hypothetical protein [Bacteroidota bacterium]
MKSAIVKLLFVVLMITFVPLTTPAQFVLNALPTQYANGVQYKFSGKVDSLSTIYSKTFPLMVSADSIKLNVGRKLTSAGTPKVSIVLQGSLDNTNWDSLLTFYTSDSLKTYSSKKTGTTSIYPNYRLKMYGTAGNRKDVTFEFYLYTWYRKEY